MSNKYLVIVIHNYNMLLVLKVAALCDTITATNWCKGFNRVSLPPVSIDTNRHYLYSNQGH